MKMLFLALAEMAAALGDAAAASDWTATAKQLGEFYAKPDGTLLLDADTSLPGSHRHLSNLIALHPFNLITADGDAREQQIIAASLADWDKSGTRAWCGYSFSWMACLRARVGDAEAALRNLDIYAHAFILRNGFHANGDQTGSGFSSFTYRPFTLEGNFLAMEAVHEMLLQSWSASPGTGEVGVIRLFPATPWRWHSAAFEDLRAEGGHRVSARRENNATTWFKIVAGRDGLDQGPRQLRRAGSSLEPQRIQESEWQLRTRMQGGRRHRSNPPNAAGDSRRARKRRCSGRG